MQAEPAGLTDDAMRGARLPRRFRLKKRGLIRDLFNRSSPDIYRFQAGGAALLVRLVDTSQLPRGVRVQVGVAARRGLKGVARNKVRRVLGEAFRVYVHPRLRDRVIPDLPEEQALTVMLVDRRRAQQGPFRLTTLGPALAAAVDQLASRLIPSPSR